MSRFRTQIGQIQLLQRAVGRSRVRSLLLVTAIVSGLAVGVVGTAWAAETYYVGSSCMSCTGTIPQQGSGASTPGVAAGTSNHAQATASCTSTFRFKAYYIESDGTVYSSSTCIVGEDEVDQGSSGGVSVYARCSTIGAYTGTGKCVTEW